MPLADDEIRWSLACGPDADGRWRGWYTVRVEAGVLRRLGLHPDQPTAALRSGQTWRTGPMPWRTPPGAAR